MLSSQQAKCIVPQTAQLRKQSTTLHRRNNFSVNGPLPKKAMYMILAFVTILLWSTTLVKPQRWFPAAMIENHATKSLSTPLETISRSDNQDLNEPVFMPLTVVSYRNLTKPNKYSFLKNKLATSTTPAPMSYIDSGSVFNFNLKRFEKPTSQQFNIDKVNHRNTTRNVFFKKPVGFKIDKTITNINVIKKSKHKGKYVRRCKNVRTRPRQGKQLEFNPNQTIQKRFLEVFEVVEFEHVACTSSSGLEGVCLPEFECQSTEGFSMGSCADGYGTCCVTQFSCDDHSAATSSWFTNPGFPSPSTTRLSCVFILEKASADIKQIRLDFNNFELLPPTAGTCEQDQFAITGQDVNNIIPILCGINTGQHVYIEVGNVDGPITLSVQTVTSDNRLFSIKVTQVTSIDELAAPTGCLQYFKGFMGYLESFNFRDKSDISIARDSSYLNNLNYAMCIERAVGTCSITYTNTGNMQIVNYDGDGLPVLPPNQAGVEIFNCPTDWLLIAAVRLCGEHLNDGSVLQDFALDAPVIDSSAGPLVVWFRSDGGYTGRGFKLQYQQNNC